MMRSLFRQFETELSQVLQTSRKEISHYIAKGRRRFRGVVQGRGDSDEGASAFWKAKNPVQARERFVRWGRDYVEKFQNSAVSDAAESKVENLFAAFRWFGLNEDVMKQAFSQNRKELLDPFVGEVIAILSLLLGWKNRDKEEFSQALGEIGALGLLAAKPLVLLVAISGLAFGYQKYYHKEAFKKGGFIGLMGTVTAFVVPGAALSLLTVLVVVLYLNRRISVEKPVGIQIREIWEDVLSGQLFTKSRKLWSDFETWMNALTSPPDPSELSKT